ncbi:hypothetical protein TRFO_27180 [Tritrichomonas foetus]|uniref:Uncharacterized protein n=1 Tax=Tritrichomonas foetus TaxID=1144522 RepID=A0A1J4K1Q6_9EUKA|nr:hypothetical protein TRFO_27180 [Tritrichomonas foetus]|eukprot:OHT05171.1 hypothetical protein TRFO_27180 [Tritrichomonas foetus]
MRRIKTFRLLRNIANVVIFLLAAANVGFQFMKPQVIPDNPDWPPVKRPLRYPQDIRILPPPPPELNYSDDELSTAIKFLNLPTWARSYVHCSNPKSEVTCSQVVRAYRVIKGWEDSISNIPLEDRKYFVIQHPVKGMGNKMTTDINGFTMALMSNRTVLVTSNYPTKKGVVFQHAYPFPPSVLINRSQLPQHLQKQSRHFESVPCNIKWSCYPVNDLILSDKQFVGINDLLYGPMVYVNKDTAKFARENFGAHAAYFVGNYFSHFPNGAIKRAQEVLALAPKGKKVLGLHIRYHRAGQYYSHGFNQTMPIVYEEVDRRLAKEDLVLAVATDNLEIKKMMIARYGSRVLMTDALRKPDKDHTSAQSDMALILGADEICATYRSTFSWIIVSKSGRRAWWIEKEAPHWFPSMNSQSAGVSMIYHWRDHCDWRTNDRVQYCGKDHRETLEYYYDYLVL